MRHASRSVLLRCRCPAFLLTSQGICVLARGKPRCSLSITVHKRASFMSFYRLIWTDRLPIVQALRKSNSSCADTPDGICSSYGPPYNFDYQLTIKGAQWGRFSAQHWRK